MQRLTVLIAGACAITACLTLAPSAKAQFRSQTEMTTKSAAATHGFFQPISPKAMGDSADSQGAIAGSKRLALNGSSLEGQSPVQPKALTFNGSSLEGQSTEAKPAR